MNAVKKGSMSMRKDRSPCKEESAELTVGEFVSPLYENIPTLDNEAPDTYCSVETEPNISYQTVVPAAMWHTHWRVDESGISGHDKQQSPVSQWSHGAQ